MIDRILLRRIYKMLPGKAEPYDPENDPVIQQVNSVSDTIDRITDKIRRNDLADSVMHYPARKPQRLSQGGA